MCVKENKFLTHFVAKKLVLMEKKVAKTLFDKNKNVIVINHLTPFKKNLLKCMKYSSDMTTNYSNDYNLILTSLLQHCAR